MYEKELQNLGLSEKESKVYLAALELGPETVQNIARKADINRPTAYLQIELLKQKGLVSEFEKGKKTYYSAESPERVLSLLNNFQQELEFKKSEVMRILPALNDLFAGAGEKPKVRFFEGIEGVKAMQNDFLAVKDKKIESFTNLDKLFELFPQHEDEYTKQRINKGIKAFVIYTRKEGPVEDATSEKNLREAKYLDQNKIPMSADVTIFDNKVALITYKAKPVSVIIEDADIAAAIRAIFYSVWNSIDT